MQINEFLNSVCEQIKYKPIRKSISKELENHIEESKENYIKEGLKEKEAEEKAIIQMGSAEEIGKNLNKIHKPKLDWKLILITIVMLLFGFLIAFTKTANSVTEDIQINYMEKYLIFLLIGVALGIGVYFIDYKKILKFSNIIYFLACAIILFTINFGGIINGKPYIRIGVRFISASVVVFPLYIISFVGFMNQEIKENKLSKFLTDRGLNVKTIKRVCLSVLSLYFLALIPSMASAFILGLVYLILESVKIIMYDDNKLKKFIMLWGIVFVIALVILIYFAMSRSYVLYRFQSTFDPESDSEGRRMVRCK